MEGVKKEGVKMVRMLLYDGGCTACSALAQEVADVVGGDLELLSLGDSRARDLLDWGFPEGWAYAPYVLEVGADGVRAYRGPSAYLKLGVWVGLIRALRIWRIVSRRLVPLQGARRGFLRGAGASLAALLFLAGRGGVAGSATIQSWGSVEADKGQLDLAWPIPGPCDLCGKHCRSWTFLSCHPTTCHSNLNLRAAWYRVRMNRHGPYARPCCSYCGTVTAIYACACAKA